MTFMWKKQAIAAALLMCIASGAAVALKPTRKVSDQVKRPSLEQVVPKQFGEWRLDPQVVPVTVSPEIRAKLNQIYNETLSRTYIDSQGRRVMLSIAYGGDQSDSTQMHRPEVCYTAQGFSIRSLTRGVLESSKHPIPVARLVATQGPRIEPITYWMTVGDRVVLSTLQHKLAQMRFGLTGTVPDGMLFRVSSITPQTDQGYALQREFIEALILAMPASERMRFFGLAHG